MLCVTVSDNTSSDTDTEEHNMAEQESAEKTVVRQVFERIDDHDPDVFEELISADVTTGVYRSGSGDEVVGRDGMKALWQEYWEAFPDLRGVSTELVQEDNRVAIFRKEEGTHEGEFRGIDPTGREITFEYSGYVDVEDDQIVHAYFHGDILDLLKQMGIESPIPEP